MNIIIPIGGKGERFLNKGYDKPKHLITILNKPMISYLLDNLKISKNDKVFIIYHTVFYKYQFSDFINDKYPFVNLIPLSYQTSGAAETLGYGINYIINNNIDYHQKSIILDCDTFYLYDIINLSKNINENCLFYFKQNENDDSPIYSYIKLDQNIVTDIIEKQRISNNANTGAYLFNDINILKKYIDKIINENIRFNNEYYISCVIKEMLIDNIIFTSNELSTNQFKFLGTPDLVNKYIDNKYAFLFDLDGTIVSTDNIYSKVWKELLSIYNIDITEELFIKYVQGNNDLISLSNIFKNNISLNIQEISNKKDELFLKNIDYINIIPGGIEFIKQLKLLDHSVAIVTNSNKIAATNILKKIGIYDYLDIIITSDDVNKPKPFPDPYIKAIEYLGISNSKTIIFEDSTSGILSAKGVFPKCIYGIVNNNKDYLIEIGTDIQIDNYENLNISDIINFSRNDLSFVKNLVYNNSKIFNHQIKDITINSNKLKGGFIADVVGVDIVFKNNDSISCVLKIQNEDSSELTSMANNLDLYGREYYFYENIRNYININSPYCYGILKGKNLKSKAILLENINTPEYTLNLDLNKENIDVSLIVIKRIAELHSKFMNNDLLNIFPLLKKNNDKQFSPQWGNFVESKWSQFESKWSVILTNKQIELGRLIVKNFSNIQNHLSNNNLTLCHGDVKSCNIFYKDIGNNIYEPYFIDWQYIVYGKGVQDLVFFMIESFEINVIQKYNNIFKEYYYIELNNNNYKKDDFENDFKAAICYFPFFVAIWFGTLPKEDLIDINFPFFFIQKMFNFLENNVNVDFFNIFN